jgi:hypothetical protein
LNTEKRGMHRVSIKNNQNENEISFFSVGKRNA